MGVILAPERNYFTTQERSQNTPLNGRLRHMVAQDKGRVVAVHQLSPSIIHVLLWRALRFDDT
jgi:hypothetical protein